VAGPGGGSKPAETSGAPGGLLPLPRDVPIFLPVNCQQLVLVGDAHLGRGTAESEAALLTFLEAVPDHGDGLVITGDLFEFWFAYRRVIPRGGLRVVAALAQLRRRVPIVMVGGNHDRWADESWQELGIEFHPREVRFQLGGAAALVRHGDGITESHWSARVLHRITSHDGTVALFRALHPDLGFWLVDHLSGALGDTTRDPAVLDRAAAQQREWALARLTQEPGLGLVAMGHTHRPAVAEAGSGLYVNPGPWCEGRRYAVVTEGSATLMTFPG